MKKKFLMLFTVISLSTSVFFSANATDEGNTFSFTTSCGTHYVLFYGTPSQQWAQAIAYGESISCNGEIPRIYMLAPAENPPS